MLTHVSLLYFINIFYLELTNIFQFVKFMRDSIHEFFYIINSTKFRTWSYIN